MYQQLLRNIRNAGGANTGNISINFNPLFGLQPDERAAYNAGLSNIRQRLIRDFTNAGVKNLTVEVTSTSSKPVGSSINITN